MNVPKITDYNGQGIIPQLVKTVNALCDEVQANQLVGDNRTTFINRSRYGTTIRSAAQGVSGRGAVAADPFDGSPFYSVLNGTTLTINAGFVRIPGHSYLICFHTFEVEQKEQFYQYYYAHLHYDGTTPPTISSITAELEASNDSSKQDTSTDKYYEICQLNNEKTKILYKIHEDITDWGIFGI